MNTRLHITSFVALTIVVLVVVLWFRGVEVVSSNFIAAFGTVVTVVFGISIIFSKYAWAWPVFRGWYVKRPDLRGTWQAQLASSHEVDGEQVSPIEGFVVVRQSLISLSMRLMTEESRSVLVAQSIVQEEDGLYRVYGVYRNEPDIELQGVRSEIHHGSFSLAVHGSPAQSMDGHYWTDRGTRGGMTLSNRLDECFETYKQATAAAETDGS
jgi:hypothetical protein